MESHHLRFEPAVSVDPSSGLPEALETVGESLAAVERLPRSVTGRVHWRFATAILRLVSTGHNDVGLARQALTSALAAEGWLAKRGAPTCNS